MVDLNIQLPEGFLNEEIRCDYLITRKVKEHWAVLLDLLAEFDRVCKKHKIKYYASGGTMLGAVRHKGFIPWDDDIDVMMDRINYDKLNTIGPQEFKEPYFFQNKYTDPLCNDCFAKIRRSDTTALLPNELGSCIDYNKGIFIDIMPLDNIPDNEEECRIYIEEIKKLQNNYYSIGRKLGIYSDSTNKGERVIKHLLYKVLKTRRNNHIHEYLDSFSEFEEHCRKYSTTQTKLFTTLFTYAKRDYKYTEDYNELIEEDFEFMRIPIGAKYEHGLSVRYGDWKKPVKGGALHEGLFIDTNLSYKKYLTKL